MVVQITSRLFQDWQKGPIPTRHKAKAQERTQSSIKQNKRATRPLPRVSTGPQTGVWASTPTPHKPGKSRIYISNGEGSCRPLSPSSSFPFSLSPCGRRSHLSLRSLPRFLGYFSLSVSLSAMDRRKEEARDDSDGWVEDALQTDFMAANMLVRLSGSSRQPLKWLRRLPRSRQQQQPPSNAIAHVKEIRDSARASPSTPLSFSGSSSPSACDDPVRPAKRSRIDDSSSQSEKTHARAAPATTDTRSKVCSFVLSSFLPIC